MGRYCARRALEGPLRGCESILCFYRVGAMSIEIRMTMSMGERTAASDSMYIASPLMRCSRVFMVPNVGGVFSGSFGVVSASLLCLVWLV